MRIICFLDVTILNHESHEGVTFTCSVTPYVNEAECAIDPPDPTASFRCYFSTPEASDLRLGSAFGEPTCTGKQETTTTASPSPGCGVLSAARATSTSSGAPRPPPPASTSHANSYADTLDFTCRCCRFPGVSRHVGRGAVARAQ